ncbi:MAG: glycosyltransferase family 2 protein [Acidimicrobiia bacterium]|nr:glycosyltransferase family 2 protein [Acidimicrobiia bacterium]
MRISVVVPVHNEADYLRRGVSGITEAIAQVDADVDVCLVENGSTDNTAEIAEELRRDRPWLSLLQLPAPDYGGAIRAGFLAAQGDWAVLFDIDYYSGEFLSQVMEASDNADVVIASKRAPGSDDRRSWVRRLATRVFNLILRVILGSGVSDTHGMKALRRDVIQAVAADVVSRQDLFDTELVIRAERAGFAISEVPVTVEEQREARSSLLKRVPRTLRGVWRIRQTLQSG